MCSVVGMSSSASQIMNFLASEDAYKYERTLFREGFARLGSRQVHTVTEALVIATRTKAQSAHIFQNHKKVWHSWLKELKKKKKRSAFEALVENWLLDESRPRHLDLWFMTLSEPDKGSRTMNQTVGLLCPQTHKALYSLRCYIRVSGILGWCL